MGNSTELDLELNPVAHATVFRTPLWRPPGHDSTTALWRLDKMMVFPYHDRRIEDFGGSFVDSPIRYSLSLQRALHQDQVGSSCLPSLGMGRTL